MNILRKLILLFLVLINSIAINAQQPPVEMADTMRSNGRIYVVVAVVITILLGLVLFVTRIDRKLSRLEKNSD
jgi:CcmD family protein